MHGPEELTAIPMVMHKTANPVLLILETKKTMSLSTSSQ
jgi:hypothetical protein